MPDDVSDKRAEHQRPSSASIPMTTAFLFANREIDHEVEVISADSVYGMNIIRDFFAIFRDIFGGRCATVQDVLETSRTQALCELRHKALDLGADGIIGLQFSYEKFSAGPGVGLIMVVVSGTAVKFK